MARSESVRRGERAQRLGEQAEAAVADDLRRGGWSVREQGHLQTATDIVAQKGPRKWYVQVKASASGDPAWPGGDEIGRLQRPARRYGGTAVVALVTAAKRQMQIEYRSAADRRKLSA